MSRKPSHSPQLPPDASAVDRPARFAERGTRPAVLRQPFRAVEADYVTGPFAPGGVRPGEREAGPAMAALTKAQVLPPRPNQPARWPGSGIPVRCRPGYKARRDLACSTTTTVTTDAAIPFGTEVSGHYARQRKGSAFARRAGSQRQMRKPEAGAPHVGLHPHRRWASNCGARPSALAATTDVCRRTPLAILVNPSRSRCFTRITTGIDMRLSLMRNELLSPRPVLPLTTSPE